MQQGEGKVGWGPRPTGVNQEAEAKGVEMEAKELEGSPVAETLPSQQPSVTPSPLLLLMKGHPGSGKSTLAASLARRLRWPIIDKDDVRDGTQVLQDPPVSCPPGILNAFSYDVMWRVVDRQLGLGLSVVVDCPLARPELFERGCQVAASNGATLAVLECRPSNAEEWFRRLELRGRSAMVSGSSSIPASVPSVSQSSVDGGVPRASLRSDGGGESSVSLDRLNGEVSSGFDGGVPNASPGISGRGAPSVRVGSADGGVSSAGPSTVSGRDAPNVSKGSVDGGGPHLPSPFQHKPATRDQMKAILEGYKGCWAYDTAPHSHLVIDTTTQSPEDVVEMAIAWLQALL